MTRPSKMFQICAIFAIISSVVACSTTTDKLAQVKQMGEQTKEVQKEYTTCQTAFYQASEVVRVDLTDDGKVKSFIVGNQNLEPCIMAKLPTLPDDALVTTIKVGGRVLEVLGGKVIDGAVAIAPVVGLTKMGIDLGTAAVQGAGHNTTITDSYKTSEANINEANVTKTATGDLLDAGSTKDASTTNIEDISGTKVGGNIAVDNSQQNQDNPVTTTTDSSTKDSQNGDTDNSSVDTPPTIPVPQT